MYNKEFDVTIITSYVRPPVPTGACDWAAYTEEHEGQICCYGATEKEAIENLLEELAWIEDTVGLG